MECPRSSEGIEDREPSTTKEGEPAVAAEACHKRQKEGESRANFQSSLSPGLPAAAAAAAALSTTTHCTAADSQGPSSTPAFRHKYGHIEQLGN